jgi:hypothetical protein
MNKTKSVTDEIEALTGAMSEALEALADSRKYLTEFGSVEPSALVRRISAATANLSRQKDEVFYRDQWRTINAARAERGEEPLSYALWRSGADE